MLIMWPFKSKTSAVRVVSADVAASLPKPRVIHQDHEAAAAADAGPRTIRGGIDSAIRFGIVIGLNNAHRHCRIGKITMKG
jgi:hypothetical protein